MRSKITASLMALSFTVGGTVLAKTVDAVIKLKERVSIASLAQSVMDPSSARYGKFYSPSEIRKLVAPRKVDYANAISQLQDEGFQIVSESPTHLWVTIRGDHTLFESVFGTKIAFGTARSGEEIHSLVQSASVPERLSLVDSIGGLDTTRKFHHHHVMLANSQDAAPGGLSPTQVQTAYGFNPIYKSGVNGAGQHIAIATYDGFMVGDVTNYYKLLKISPAPTVDQVTYNGTPTYNEDSAVETQLDAEFSGMMAPGASVHVFASAQNSDLGEEQMFTAILDDNRAKTVNYSWGECETGLDPTHVTNMTTIFNRAVAQGVNIMVASGDSGSDGCGDGTNAADWPAAHPAVVGVGGTTLTISGTTMSEAGWSGSGGGFSALFPVPSWQTSAVPAGSTGRGFPDVSFNADPNSGQAVYAHQNGTAGWIVIGGTSMAAPQWTGFLTLVNQARANAGKQQLGFLNPFIYALSASNYASMMNDVTSGNNGEFNAGTAWDAVTGLGSMQASNLLSYLSQQ